MSTKKVAVVMGSTSDWDTLQHAVQTLQALKIPYEAKVVSAHRTPDLLFQFAAEARAQGFAVIIAGAGGAAHLPGMLAAKTSLPVLGVPILATSLQGMDALLSMVQMPAGVPVGTLAIGKPGAINAALLAASMLSVHDQTIAEALADYRQQQTERVLAARLES